MWCKCILLFYVSCDIMYFWCNKIRCWKTVGYWYFYFHFSHTCCSCLEHQSLSQFSDEIVRFYDEIISAILLTLFKIDMEWQVNLDIYNYRPSLIPYMAYVQQQIEFVKRDPLKLGLILEKKMLKPVIH